MTSSAQQLTTMPCRNQSLNFSSQLNSSETLPYISYGDAYEDKVHTFSAYGTSMDQPTLYTRHSLRLVVSRPKMPKRRRVNRTAWPDACNSQDVASFHQKHLTSREETPSKTEVTRCALPTSVLSSIDNFYDNLRKSAIKAPTKATTPAPDRMPRRAFPPPRFSRHTGDI
ncbi:hypothetical protein B0H34DRAFT_796270 [Crassisporium funariophilum]|nr:hypothetical protein B0H34DRAFT_796270 [Crassisporium funariophilum]